MGQFHGRAFSLASVLAGICLMALLCSACTRAELVDKADAYDQAIWDSSNRQILLNAVRASQRAPMSFVGYGDVLASPNFSGSAGGAFNFSPSGLTNYALNPGVSYAGGFSQFTINNLNHQEFAKQMRKPVDPKLAQYFHRLGWPKEMVDLLLIHSIYMSSAEHAQLIGAVRAKCNTNTETRTVEFCAQLEKDGDAYEDCKARRLTLDGPEILNTAREFCSMNKFQYTLRMLRFLNKSYRELPRTPEGMLYYLGELIAAQNYSVQHYTPKLFIVSQGQHRLVDFFVVQQGASPNAAVQVSLNGDGFYIPRPQLGSMDEARSLQVMDLVSQAIVMATSKDSLPKTNSVSLVAVR
ncbi:hypothetical protein [Bradyrhizobium glycinis]|uniref:hypothetical protein n=1 Tax=Bradyrhizobium glycinis TaxID=2751812 RepID=UPI0018D82B8F|nr:hypothetical protein [Bradyrhizobium glycinis]MBH5370969.1 hypothetical protein [Bradyrhizobium glycinis]